MAKYTILTIMTQPIRRLYADEEAFCQMYHMCVSSTNGEFKKFSFLCPNGTIFDQDKLACNRWFDVDCSTDAIDVRQACWVVLYTGITQHIFTDCCG